MFLLSALVFIATIVSVESFLKNVLVVRRSLKPSSISMSLFVDKAELLKLCTSVEVGKPFPEDVSSRIKLCTEAIEASSTHESLTHSLKHLDGEWLMLFSTLPAFFQRIALRDLSAGTIQSAEPLILVRNVKQLVKRNPSGEYQYDNLVEFQGGKVDATDPPIAGLHITRGNAGLNIPESTEKTVRLNVAFYENQATPASSSKVDSDNFNRLFGFKPEDILLGTFPAAFKSWSDIVYLDENLRIMRGGKGNIYILSK